MSDDRPAGPAPTFSVLIATYNQAEYVIETLDTVAAQTFRDFELVLVNDGSTDDTEARVRGWIERLDRGPEGGITFVTTANGGQSAAFEHGIGLCRGRFVAFLDSDDRWLPRKLEAVAAVIEVDASAGMIVHPLHVIDAAGRRTGDVRPMGAKLSEGDLREQIRRTTRHVPPATTGIVIRRDVLDDLLPFPTKQFRADADAYLTFGASLHTPVKVVNEPLGEYRMHSAGHYIWRVTTGEGLRKWLDMERRIASHFGLEDVLVRNSYHNRHVFALEKLEGTPAGQWRALVDLLRSTASDPYFSPRQKLLFAGFWTACAVAPRPAFVRMWRRFQLRHTGFDRIPPGGDEAPVPQGAA